MQTAEMRPDLNVVSPENMLNPLPVYRRLREYEPVHWSEALHAWFVTRHEDVANCLRDPRMSADRTRLFVEHQLRDVGPEIIRDHLEVASRQMLMKDGAEHARIRRNANPGFTAHAIDGWRNTIRQAVVDLMDKLQPRGRMDLVPDFSEPFPLRVMAELFGLPREIWGDFKKWSDDVIALFGMPMGADVREVAARGNASMRACLDYLGGLVEERRVKPGNDMLSIMIHSQEEGKLDKMELLANINLISVAGHVTTVDQLSNGVHALLTHPDQLQLLRENPALIKSAVEEVLRYNPTMPFVHRIALEDFELRGHTIQRGQLVFLGLAAANHDPEVFPDPERFDITRQSNKHMTFAFGPHTCLGSILARYNLELGLGGLFERLPGLRLDKERPARVKCHSLVFRGFNSLPVRW